MGDMIRIPHQQLQRMPAGRQIQRGFSLPIAKMAVMGIRRDGLARSG